MLLNLQFWLSLKQGVNTLFNENFFKIIFESYLQYLYILHDIYTFIGLLGKYVIVNMSESWTRLRFLAAGLLVDPLLFLVLRVQSIQLILQLINPFPNLSSGFLITLILIPLQVFEMTLERGDTWFEILVQIILKIFNIIGETDTTIVKILEEKQSLREPGLFHRT